VSLHENFGKGNKDANPTLTANDIVYTPRDIARQMIAFYTGNLVREFGPEVGGISQIKHDVVLDPCRGDGSFYDQYPDYCTKDWCEITDGRDFFDWDKQVDWIITNPPYSIYEEFCQKAFEVADNVCFLVPLSKIVSSLGRIQSIMDYGGFVSIHIIGASKCGFPFGFPAAAVHMKRGYQGKTEIKMWEDRTQRSLLDFE
jgi:hypothetical protein|tara:strand:- start:157 stop:756 length:600 start_codon:yes stop_codon:yes gene_type:complete